MVATTTKPRVIVTAPLIDGGLDKLEACCEIVQHDLPAGPILDKLDAELETANALVTLLSHRVDEALLSHAPQLRIVANYAVGVDNIELPAASARGVYVTNTPGVLTEATADLAWAALLALSRRVVEGDALVRGGHFGGWGPTMLLGSEISGKTLGIVGFGAIGRAVARRAAGFGLRVLYAQRPSLAETTDLGLLTAHGVALDELLAQSDFVSLNVPATVETHHLLDGPRLDALKNGALVVNTARGKVIDEAALVERLRDGRVAGAALDVYENEPALSPGLAELSNVLLLPHLGSATRETRRAMAEMVAENVLAALEGRLPPQALDKTARGSANT